MTHSGALVRERRQPLAAAIAAVAAVASAAVIAVDYCCCSSNSASFSWVRRSAGGGHLDKMNGLHRASKDRNVCNVCGSAWSFAPLTRISMGQHLRVSCMQGANKVCGGASRAIQLKVTMGSVCSASCCKRTWASSPGFI